MIIQPKVRGYICTTAHPVGCAYNVQQQMAYVLKQGPLARGPKRVLVVGASTGYGLASRIVAAGALSAATVGVFFERPAEGKKTATAGWYNSVAFEKLAAQKGLYARSVNGDAFSDQVKQETIALIKRDLQQVDLLVYSLAAPRRIHPRTGEIFKSALKPIGAGYTNKSIDFETGQIIQVSLEAATEEEVRHTVAVMGGEDWEMWVDALLTAGVLAPSAMTVAYSYVGPEITRDIYRRGTIGAAKDHLEATAQKLHQRLLKIKGSAFISVNKALVTQSSSAIPFIPLYYVLLNKVMAARGVNEGCIEQIYRLFSENLYGTSAVPTDEAGRIRVDDKEMLAEVQAEVQKNWQLVDSSNIAQLADLRGYDKEFLNLFGFDFPQVDYNADVDPFVCFPQE